MQGDEKEDQRYPKTMRARLADLGDDRIQTIVDLENANMAPILERAGFYVTPELIRHEILRHPNQHIVFAINEEGQLQGVLRAKPTGNDLFVTSIQLRPGESLALLRTLLREGRELLASLENIETVTSIAQKSNPRSISLHRRLGFEVTRDLEKALRFQIKKSILIERIKIDRLGPGEATALHKLEK